jgi:hypothetical protein
LEGEGAAQTGPGGYFFRIRPVLTTAVSQLAAEASLAEPVQLVFKLVHRGADVLRHLGDERFTIIVATSHDLQRIAGSRTEPLVCSESVCEPDRAAVNDREVVAGQRDGRRTGGCCVGLLAGLEPTFPP